MKLTPLFVLSVAVLSALGSTQAQTFNVYIGAPGAQTSVHSGTTGFVTETFNTGVFSGTGVRTTNVASPGLTSFSGTYNFTGSTGAIVAADQYGGADGTGNFVAMGNFWTGNDNSYSLTLGANSANYFGFWWSAGDQYNFVEFYNDGVLLATFTSANIFTSLNGGVGTISSVNGSIYNTNAYYGNPNSPPQNVGEPYAYVSIYASGGTVFDEIRFDNGLLTPTGFESDNHSLYDGALIPSGTEVFVSTIPEPGTTLLFGMSATWLLIMRRRRSA